MDTTYSRVGDLENLAKAYLSLGDSAKVVECSKLCLIIARSIGDTQGEEVALGILDNALENYAKGSNVQMIEKMDNSCQAEVDKRLE